MAINTQSKPLIPGLRDQPIRKKIIVNGAKRPKRRGQIQVLNAEPNRPGLIIHHINIASRGPKSIKIVVAQHIFFLQQVFSKKPFYYRLNDIIIIFRCLTSL
jgi:hypothetical protein